MRVESEDGTLVCDAALADNPVTRLRGLLGRSGLAEAEGLLLRPGSSIHTHFMRFAIDAVFLDGDGGVKGVRANMRPWRMASCRGAKQVLELAAGSCARLGIAPGQRLVLVGDAASGRA